MSDSLASLSALRVALFCVVLFCVAVLTCLTLQIERAGHALGVHFVSGEGTRFTRRMPLGNEAELARTAPDDVPPARFGGVHLDGLAMLVIDDVRDGVHRLPETRSRRVMAVESAARLGKTTDSGSRLLHKPLVPEESFDAIGEFAGRRHS